MAAGAQSKITVIAIIAEPRKIIAPEAKNAPGYIGREIARVVNEVPRSMYFKEYLAVGENNGGGDN